MVKKFRRKSFGAKIIGKSFKCDKDTYSVIKTKMGYYPRVRGKRYHSIGKRYKTASGARKELLQHCKIAKQAIKEMKKR